MKGAAIYGERSLFHHFAEPRMAVTDARDIFSSPAKLHSNNAFLNKIASRWADDMDTYNSIGLSIGAHASASAPESVSHSQKKKKTYG